MIPRNTRRGFTLIELLVTVLIIAILAAVAMPQYQRAVHRAEMAEAYALMDAFEKAQATYYLTHSTYIGFSLEALDIELPTLKYFKYCTYPQAQPCVSDEFWSFSPFLLSTNFGYNEREDEHFIGIFNQEISLQKAFGGSLKEGQWMCYGVRKGKGETHFDICSKYVECDSSVSGTSSAGETKRSCYVVR